VPGTIGHYLLKRSVLAVLAGVTLISPLPASAQTAEFMPAAPWMVGPTALAQVRASQGGAFPCVMVGQYDNGFIVRLSGGAGQILAMAVDFRQNIFRQGQAYDANLSVDGAAQGSVKGTAFSPNVLIFNVRPLPQFYQALQRGQRMDLSLSGNVMSFSLANVGEGLQRLESCYAAPQSGAEPVQTASDDPDMRRNAMPRRQGMATDRGGINASAPAVWSARSGETVRTVLTRWSAQAGTDIDWRAAGGGLVQQDVQYNGTFEEAVSSLLAASGGVQARVQPAASSAPSPLSALVNRPAVEPVAPPAAAMLPVPQSPAAWTAPRGASLQAVLEQWSRKQGIELMWSASGDYPLKTDIAQNGPFESALMVLLETYSTDRSRPVARLNTDPQTGRKLLMVQSDRAI